MQPPRPHQLPTRLRTFRPPPMHEATCPLRAFDRHRCPRRHAPSSCLRPPPMPEAICSLFVLRPPPMPEATCSLFVAFDRHRRIGGVWRGLRFSRQLRKAWTFRSSATGTCKQGARDSGAKRAQAGARCRENLRPRQTPRATRPTGPSATTRDRPTTPHNSIRPPLSASKKCSRSGATCNVIVEPSGGR